MEGSREKRPISKDSRWSDEVICDGRSVRLARSENIINDGRQRQRTSHPIKHKINNPISEDEVPKRNPSTKEEMVREAWKNVGNHPSPYIIAEHNSRDITHDMRPKSTGVRPTSKACSEPAMNMTRRQWRTAKDTRDSPLAGKSGAAEREKRF